MPSSFLFNHKASGTKIKGMAVVYDDILIFKERKIYRLWGTDPSQLQKVELFNASGAIADKSIISTPQGCFFVHKDGIYLYDGSNVAKISQKIPSVVFDDNAFMLNTENYTVELSGSIQSLGSMKFKFTEIR